MSKGGLMPKKSDGSINHLFKNKWNLGKTTNVRIPMVMKDELKEVAKYFDSLDEYQLNNRKIIDYINEANELKKQISLRDKEIQRLNQELEFKNKIVNLKIHKGKVRKIESRYQTALQCFMEYLTGNNLEIPNDKLPKKGTLKRQLVDIMRWFQSESEKSED